MVTLSGRFFRIIDEVYIFDYGGGKVRLYFIINCVVLEKVLVFCFVIVLSGSDLWFEMVVVGGVSFESR